MFKKCFVLNSVNEELQLSNARNTPIYIFHTTLRKKRFCNITVVLMVV